MKRYSFLLIALSITFVHICAGDVFITSKMSHLIDSTYRVMKYYQEGYTTDTCFLLMGEIGNILIEKDAIEDWVNALKESKTIYNEWSEKAHNQGLTDFHKNISITFPAIRVWNKSGITNEVMYNPIFYMRQGQTQLAMEGDAPLPQHSDTNITCRVKFALVLKQSSHFDEIIHLLTTGNCPIFLEQIKEGKSAIDNFFKK